MNEQEELAELLRQEAEHAEQTRDDPYPPNAKGTRPGRSRSVVYSVRLDPEEVAALERLAAQTGLPASSLVRSWIIENTSAGPVSEKVRRVIRDEVRDAVREAMGA